MRYFQTLNSFYTSKEWKQLKKILMHKRLNANGELICEHCKKIILHEYDCIPHHYKTHLTIQNVNDVNISLNEDNLMLVHHSCHNEIHKRFTSYQSKVYLIHGSPLSGKTSWVYENSDRDDLVVDLDTISKMLNPHLERYDKNNRLKTNVFMIRDMMYDMIKTRAGKWVNAYIITTMPRVMDRKRLADTLGAELIHIDTSKETCIERLYDNPNGRDIKLWTNYIEEYFAQYQEDELV